MVKVLIVEDDKPTRDVLHDLLSLEGYRIDAVADGFEAIGLLDIYEYDLAILDWSLPGLSGVEICKKLRAMKRATPILMLTARDTIASKEVGFQSGADDYLTKPFDARELALRANALLRRTGAFDSNVYCVQDLVIDESARSVMRGDVKINLRRLEFDLLVFLVQHADRVLDTNTILRSVWKNPAEVTQNSVYTCITRLRTKLNVPGESLIETVHGVGYKLNSNLAKR